MWPWNNLLTSRTFRRAARVKALPLYWFSRPSRHRCCTCSCCASFKSSSYSSSHGFLTPHPATLLPLCLPPDSTLTLGLPSHQQLHSRRSTPSLVRPRFLMPFHTHSRLPTQIYAHTRFAPHFHAYQRLLAPLYTSPRLPKHFQGSPSLSLSTYTFLHLSVMPTSAPLYPPTLSHAHPCPSTPTPPPD